MIWPILFSIGLVQGIFLVGILSSRKNENRLAARLLIALLFLFVLSNYDDLLLASRWYASLPWTFGASLASFFAYGPLFYLYLRAVTEPDFVWHRRHWLHFLPFLLFFLLYLPISLMSAPAKVAMLDGFWEEQFAIRPFDIGIALFKTMHFGTYIFMAFRQIKKVQVDEGRGAYQVPFGLRAKWLKKLVFLFSLIFLALLGVSLFHIFHGFFVLQISFGFTLLTCSIMYFMAYKLMLRPELVTPGFAEKYAAQRLPEAEEESLLQEVGRYLDSGKIFNDPELKLRSMAADLNIPPHRLSMLINDRYGKSFSDFINQQRVEEFIRRLNDPQFAHLTLFGLALEVGFNSKSAFNAAFKKIKGRPPSDFRG